MKQLYKPIIAVVGQSGSGKSTSLRSLDPARTLLIDMELKGFPFKGAEKFTVVSCASCSEAVKAFKEGVTGGKYDTIVIESFTKYNELSLTQAATVTNNDGFKTYAMLERMTGAFLDSLKNTTATVIVTAIDEIVKIPAADLTESSTRRIATKGRSWEGKVEKEFVAVFFTQVLKTKDGEMQYMFQTNTDGITSAKTPMGMFNEKLIPNDMSFAIEKLNKYYEA